MSTRGRPRNTLGETLVGKLLNKILRAGEGRTLKKLKVITEQVNALESSFEDMTDDGTARATDEFKERLADGESLDDLLPEAFATVREPPGAPSGSAPTTCRSWEAPPSTSATSPR